MKSRWIHCLYPEGLNAQYQSMLIAKDTRLLDGADEGGGEFLAMWSHLVTL